jgi:hypothetical protein
MSGVGIRQSDNQADFTGAMQDDGPHNVSSGFQLLHVLFREHKLQGGCSTRPRRRPEGER